MPVAIGHATTDRERTGTSTRPRIGANAIHAGGTPLALLKARAMKGTMIHQSAFSIRPRAASQIRVNRPAMTGSIGTDKRSGFAHSLR